MINKEKFFIGILILVIILSVGSIAIISNINSGNIQEKIIYEENQQSGNLNLIIMKTPENSEVNK